MPIIIKSAPAFVTEDGASYPTLEDAQLHELNKLFITNPNGTAITQAVFSARKEVLAIFATEPKKARKPRAAKDSSTTATDASGGNSRRTATQV